MYLFHCEPLVCYSFSPLLLMNVEWQKITSSIAWGVTPAVSKAKILEVKKWPVQENTLKSMIILVGIISLLAMIFLNCCNSCNYVQNNPDFLAWLPAWPSWAMESQETLAWERLVQNFHTNCFFIFIPGTLQHAQSKNKLQVGFCYYAGQRAV